MSNKKILKPIDEYSMFRTVLLLLFLSICSVSFGQSKIKLEDILIKNDSIELSGTLTFSEEKSTLIIWVHGSGNVDRNGNQGVVIRANYIAQFRDSINKYGVSFFSFDKRTANPKNFTFLKNTLFDDFVNDLQKVISHFKDDNRFTEIVLVGHSQGSLIAMLASEKVDKYISLAGPSKRIDETIIEQITAQTPALGKIAEEHFEEIKETGEIKQVNPMLMTVFAKQNLDFLKSWMQYNPSEEIKKLKIPVLIINGDKDLQVSTDDAKALHKVTLNSKLVLVKNMNHVIKTVNSSTENQQSYFSADFPLSEELISTIVEFIRR